MSRPYESVPAAGEVSRTIETIDQAAAEITRLHTMLSAVAVDLTPEYLDRRLAGEEGVTWDMFPRNSPAGRPTAILDPVVRHNGALLLGAGYNAWSKEYKLSQGAALVPAGDGAFVRAGSITLHRPVKGYRPGVEYVVVGDRILEAGHHKDSVPTVEAGKTDWSAPGYSFDGTFREMTEVTPGLLDTIDEVQSYLPVVEPYAAGPTTAE
ncbi:MAG TPA: hypothetical protein VIM53_02445 [Candidatus Saccharimonadales bacterium]